MQKILRYLLLVVAIFGVASLGYYAYVLSTDTFSFAFVGSEKQEGNMIRLPLVKPHFLMSREEKSLVDTGALLGSLRKNGSPWNPTVSGEGNIFVSGEYVQIASYVMNPGDTLSLDADKYNATKTTEYRLPKNIQTTFSDIPYDFSVSPVGMPKDHLYEVRMYGYGGLTPKDVRFYTHTDVGRPCRIEDAWDSSVWRKVPAYEVTNADAGQIYKRTYSLDFPHKEGRICLVAGIAGNFFTIEDDLLSPLSATGSAVSVLSPEYDMKSEIEFRFSHELYVDTGALYSKSYFENRKKIKLDFLKKIEITPNVALTEESISFTPDKLTLLAKFEEGQKYTIKLHDIEDIYGRKTTVTLPFTPTSEPFLSLGLDKRRSIFRVDEPLSAKIYALKTPKNTYTLKLCRISLQGYALTERIIDEHKKSYEDTLYSMLDGGKEVTNCSKKDIILGAGASVTNFDIRQIAPTGTLTPGLYILAFRDRADVSGFSRMILPRVFSLVDSQITMKVDASGQMSFLVTDIATGNPRPNQSLSLLQNISRSYIENWNPVTQKSERQYLPINTSFFATGITLGTTDQGGYATVKQSTLPDYSSPYGLMNEPYWDYEGRYSSFLATSTGDGHFGYVVSTWNDGITGWNFGLKDSDYSWENRGKYLAYIHTDRRLYLPGEKVYIHALLRENGTSLKPVTNKKFTLRVLDAFGGEVLTRTLEPNEFGTLSTELELSKFARTGNYSVNILPFDNDAEYIQNSYTNFQVEIFRNPSFTAEVTLRSPDIEDETVLSLRKKPNTDPNFPWYESTYSSVITLEGMVRARYYNGAEIRGVPFTYRVYRTPYYGNDYWGDCFWGCYFEPPLEFYTEGTGSIGNDGLGLVRIPVEFSSFFSDYQYTVEVTVVDPLTGEEVVTPATLLAKMPQKYKQMNFDNPLVFTPQKKILQKGEKISGVFKPMYGKWDASLMGSYQYELIHRTYDAEKIDDLRNPDAFITTQSDRVVLSGAVSGSGLALLSQGLTAGEYHLRVSPIAKDTIEIPEYAISDTLLYIAGDVQNKNTALRVLPEKTVYRLGEKARVMITTPFTGGYLYLTRERGGVLDYEYIKMTGNTLVKEYTVDDSFAPNLYIGAVAFPGGYQAGKRNYAVGYGEMVVDLSDKKANLTLTPDKPKYQNRETVSLDVTLTDKGGNPLQGEVALMVVDESLIRLLGNIDLDIIPKFFQKYPFTTRTALSAIGMERNLFLSRKGSNGGSGDKGGGGAQIASRNLFKNTAYYNPSVRTDASGKAKVQFQLPDNVTDYRIIAIANTKDSRFGVAEKTLSVRKKYTIEAFTPATLYPGDTTTLSFQLFNATDTITQADAILTVGTGKDQKTYSTGVLLQAQSEGAVYFPLALPQDAQGNVPYTLTLKQQNTILDSLTKTLSVLPIPLLESTARQFGAFTGNALEITLPALSKNSDPALSRMSFHVAQTPLTNPKKVFESLVLYPYGCIEQTIASTLPNAIALRFRNLLGVTLDETKAQENLDAGVAKILRMQYLGGWKYWEEDTIAHPYITPYVLRSLSLLKQLGVSIPDASTDAGLSYLSDMVDYRSDLLSKDINLRAQVYLTLAQYNHPKASLLRTSLEAEFKKSLSPASAPISTHAYLLYAYGLFYEKKLTPDVEKYLEFLINTPKEEVYWYWNSTTDQAMYANFLLDTGKIQKAIPLLDTLLRGKDLSSYFVSTQEKTQLLLALTKLLEKSPAPLAQTIALRSGTIIADLALAQGFASEGFVTTRDKISNTVKITRTGNGTLFYELVLKDITKDIFTLPARQAGGMTIRRIFEKIDESKGLDGKGQFLSHTELKEAVFEKGSLYRVTLEVTPPKSSTPRYYLTLEDFMPGGWSPIRGIFQTTSAFTSESNIQPGYWGGWSHVETKNDRILATSEILWSADKRTYSYYFRPEHAGEYLLPPATAYFMYSPEIFATTQYQKVIVR